MASSTTSRLRKVAARITRAFLALAFCAGMAWSGPVPASRPASMPESMPSSRPTDHYNILYIITDQQRTDSLGCYGNTWVRTPNINNLANHGVVFDNCFVASPVCVPSRVSLLTGMLPHQTGIFENSVESKQAKWPEGLTTYPEVLAQNGYKTINLGKVHTPPHEPWQVNNPFRAFADEIKLDTFGPGIDEKKLDVIRIGKGGIYSGIYPSKVPGRTPTSYLADEAIKQLDELKNSSQPWLLRVSILAPHTPVLCPPEYYNMYKPEKMDWDKPTSATLAGLPRYEKTHSSFKPDVPDEQIRRMRASYYGLVSHIDDQVGRILDKLRETGEDRRTIIVYTSDHGCMIGEYGMQTKMTFHDIATRVPLIIAGPGVRPLQHKEALVSSIDIAPTLLKMNNVAVPEQMKRAHVLFNEKNERRLVVGEIAAPYKESKGAQQLARRSWIRTDRWSMDYTSEIGGQKVTDPKQRDGKLIDKKNDPLEHENLYYDPAHAEVVKTLTSLFEVETSQGRRPIQYVPKNKTAKKQAASQPVEE